LTSWVPPAKYKITTNWSDLPMFAVSVDKLKGKFSYKKYVTMTEQVMVDEKKKHCPPVGAYKMIDWFEKNKQGDPDVNKD
jgi:hypothetical protein